METDRLSYFLRHEAAAHGKEDYKHLVADALESLSADVEELRATIERLREYAWHKQTCGVLADCYNEDCLRVSRGLPCDCGYDKLMKKLEESK